MPVIISITRYVLGLLLFTSWPRVHEVVQANDLLRGWVAK